MTRRVRLFILVGLPAVLLLAWIILHQIRRAPEAELAITAESPKAPEKETGGEGSHEENTKEGEAGHEQMQDRVVLTPEALEGLHLVYARAELRELAPSLEVPAELAPDPDRRATVGARVPGRVVDVRVRIGDRVGKDTPLVILESDEVGRARADLVASRAKAEVARRAADRARGLRQEQIASERAVEEAEGEMQVAEAELAAARTRLATFGVSDDEETPKGSPARVVLTAPIGGIVVGRSAYLGQWAEPSEPLIEIVDLDQLWLLASVYEREMRLVQPGMEVQVEVRAYPGEVFRGTVKQIGYTLDERTRTSTIRVVLPNADHRLKPGMFATARIQGARAHTARTPLAIPWAAVQEIDNHRAVFLRVSEDVFELRRVHTGERAGDDVEILNGLVPGDEVVVDGSFLLKGELLKSTLGEEE